MLRQDLRKVLALGLGCLLVVVSTLGCTALDQGVSENPRTTVGAATGAVGGAVLGGLIFRSASGAVVGGLVGALAGGLIGNAMESRQHDYGDTAREYDYDPSQGIVIRIEKVQVEPAVIRRGEQVNLIVQYALLTPDPDRATTVAERWTITKDGRSTGNPVFTARRQDGTWASAIPVTLPTNTSTGAYQVTVSVEADRVRESGRATFTVRR